MLTVQDLGGPTAIARVLGLKPPTVSGWKQIPEHHCPDIERWKEGQVTVEQLRPELQWRRVEDATWPHPDGRPLLDFVKAEAA